MAKGPTKSNPGHRRRKKQQQNSWLAALLVLGPPLIRRIRKLLEKKTPQQRLWLLLSALAIIALVTGSFFWLHPLRPTVQTTQQGSATPTAPLHTPRWGVQSKTSGCQPRGPLPDPECTPGDIFPAATKEQVCTPGYASSVRLVPQSLKNKGYALYGITRRLPGQYEMDHLVSLQLGGSNDISNLWPEAALPRPGFPEKNRVENYLRSEVCNGDISLRDAQIEIATNWLTIYDRLPPRLKGGPEPPPDDDTSP